MLADELGRFDQEELLAHIINKALGRPLLVKTDARDVGTAANNAIKKEKKETAEAKARTGAAVSDARAAARLDPAFVPKLAAAQAARAAELAAVLAQEYNLKLPNSTVGAKRKRVQWAEAEAAERRQRPMHLEDLRMSLPGDLVLLVCEWVPAPVLLPYLLMYAACPDGRREEGGAEEGGAEEGGVEKGGVERKSVGGG